MVAKMVRGRVFAGDTMTVTVHAHTGPSNYALVSWMFTLTYDTAVLQLTSSSYSSLFVTPTVNSDASLGTLEALTTDLGTDVAQSAVSDQTELLLATFTFRVLDSVSAGAYGDVLSLVVESMINQGTLTYVAEQPAQVNDLRDGVQTSGQLQVDAVSVVGLMAYPATAELANTAVLDGADVTSEISVVELRNRPSELPSAASPSDYACSADGSGELFELEACTVVVTSGAAQGGTDNHRSVAAGRSDVLACWPSLAEGVDRTGTAGIKPKRSTGLRVASE